MNCYFCSPIPGPRGRVAVDAAESRHAATARRQRAGDRVLLIDGSGRRAEATIVSLDRTAMELRVESVEHVQRPRPGIVLASAVAKGDRQRVLLEMATQMGVVDYVPLLCDRSTVRPDSHNVPRWVRVCTEACKQSHNPYLPRIGAVQAPGEFAAGMKHTGTPVYLASPGGDPLNPGQVEDRVAVCVGPEGGFSDDELAQMIDAGARPFSLGPYFLRIETAAVAAVGMLRAGSR